MNYRLLIVTILISTFTFAQKTSVYNEKDIIELADLANRLKQDQDANKERAIKRAEELNLPLRVEYDNGEIVEIQGITPDGKLLYNITDNLDAARTVSTDKVWPGGSLGFALSGGSVVVGEWDGGGVLLTHRELTPRVTQGDVPSGNSDHATHVAGTMIASGVTPTAKGMAYTADLDAYDWNSDNSEMATAASNGMLISNHSYGTITGWRYNSGLARHEWWGDTTISTSEDFKFGFYNATARAWDQIAVAAPYYLIVKSAGNDRGDNHSGAHFLPYYNVTSSAARPADGGATGYDCISTSGNAKNILTVGAVNAISGGYSDPNDVVMSSFSGWGPTDDGRIKPDIVANGVGVYSSLATNDSAYASYNGTSMASPNTAGSLVLIQQHHQNVKSSYMKSATLKGLVIHTADEAGGNVGPDYQHGWGLLNTARAVEHISNISNRDQIIEASLNNNQTYSTTVTSDGLTPLRATICWTDIAGTSPSAQLDPSTQMLVNDLDLRITRDANLAVTMPFVLNPASPASGATRADNSRDNVEQVLIDTPTAGSYTITITHKGTLSSSQDFSLLISGGMSLPTSDSCSGAIALQCGIPIVGTTTGATPDPTAINCGTNVDAAGVWYKVTGNGQQMQVDLCGPTTNYDTRMNVYSGTCGAFVCVTGNDNSCGNSSSVNWSSTMGVTYYLFVQGTSNATGDFEIALSSAPASGITASSDTTFCDGDSVSLMADMSNSYQWMHDNSNIPGATSQNYIAKDSGVYQVITTDANSCSDTTTIGQQVNVLPLPTVIISASGPTTFCEGGNVVLSTPSSGPIYQWYKNGVAIPSATFPLYNIDSSGNYNLLIEDANTCADSGITGVQVTVNPLPVVNISSSGPTTFCEGENVTLSVTGGVNYQWYYNNVAIPAATNSSFLASNSGNYNVIVQDGNTCSDSAATPVTVTENPLPVANVSVSGPTTFCDGGSVNLTANGGSNYQWFKDGVIIPSATNTTYSATTTGLYNVLVESGNNCSDSLPTGVTVTVNPLPIVSISNVGPTTFCANDSVELTTSATGTYQWHRNGSAIAGANASGFFAKQSGIYNVLVTDGNTCEDSAATGTSVTVNSLPVVNITTNGPTTFCDRDSVTLSTTTPGNYQWYRDGSTIASAASASYIAKNAGNYNVVVTDGNNCEDSASSGTTVVINPLPIVNINSNGITEFCDEDSAQINVTTPGTYQWIRNGASIVNATSNSIFVKDGGVYNTVVTDGNNCSDTATSGISMTKNPLPVISLNVMGNSELCDGDSVIIGANGANQYVWYRNGSILPDTGNQFTAYISGAFNVLGTDLNGCMDSATTAEDIVVNDLPNVQFSAVNPLCNTINSYILTEGTPAGGVYSGTGVTTDSIFDPQSAGVGMHWITYTYVDPVTSCANEDSIEIEVVNCVGIVENSGIKGMTIYPNPAKEEINIRFTNIDGQAKMKLLGLDGKELMSEGNFVEVQPGHFKLQLDEIAAGLYMLQIRMNNKTEFHKIVLQ